MAKLSIRDLNLANKRVFMRVDFNVPIETGRVTDSSRIEATLPTIRYAQGQGARLVLASHLGRPKGAPDPKFSLKPVAEKLSELLGSEVGLAPDCVGNEVKALVERLTPGSVLLLENLRFHAEEEKNDAEFSRQLGELAEVYVNDAFGSAHRAHASTEGITKFVKPAAAGLLMEKELDYLNRAITTPDHPFVIVLGGAKVADKVPVIENLARLADTILIGGAMAYTLLRARGYEVGESRVEYDQLELAEKLIAEAELRRVEFLLPVDHVIVEKGAPEKPPRVVSTETFSPSGMGMDIGPETVKLYSDRIANAKMVIWNGPVGVFEKPPFDQGTIGIARALAACRGTTIIGGGDSIAAVHHAGVADRISHLSTGGGATLEFLAGIELPGVRALSEKS